MKNDKIKILIEIVLINLFILNLAVSAISNYSGKIFFLKGIVSLSLMIIATISFKLQGVFKDELYGIINYKKILHPLKWIQNDKTKLDLDENNNFSYGLKRVFFILILFIGYLALTLTYSSNPGYGFQKILSFILSVVSSVLVLYYLLTTLNELRIKVLIYSIAVITIFTVSYILIDYPFDQSTIYHYEPGRWSHVIYGRMISSFAVVLLLYLILIIEKGKTIDEKRKIIFLLFITSIAIYGTYLSAFRAGIMGVLLVGGGLFVLLLWNKAFNIFYKKLTPGFWILTTGKILLPFLIALLLVILVPKPDIINQRLENLTAVENLQFNNDQPIQSRLAAWELSWEIIKDHPVFGTGFGGFNGYNNLEWTKFIRYPHNIILEAGVEGGVVGLLVLGSLFVVMFKSCYRYSKFTFYFLLFTLFLSMFSKEFSNQSLLWIGWAFYGLKK